MSLSTRIRAQGRRVSQCRRGLTMVEMGLSLLIASILMLALSFILLQDQKAYAALYDHNLGDLREDSRNAALAFEALVRPCTVDRARLGQADLEVYYYADPETSAQPDRYAHLYLNNARELVVDRGPLNPDGTPLAKSQTVRLARHVAALAFSLDGPCAKMTLTLAQGTQSLTTTAAANRHNEESTR